MLAPIVLPKIAQVSDLTKPLPSSFLSAFKLVIKPYLTMGKLPISLASEILNIHVRTIQRRLESEGAVYKTLIEEMVLEQVLELLRAVRFIGHASRCENGLFRFFPLYPSL